MQRSERKRETERERLEPAAREVSLFILFCSTFSLVKIHWKLMTILTLNFFQRWRRCVPGRSRGFPRRWVVRGCRARWHATVPETTVYR